MRLSSTTSIYALLFDHIESVYQSTGRRPSWQQAAIDLDKARGIEWRQPVQPCQCPKCLKTAKEIVLMTDLIPA